MPGGAPQPNYTIISYRGQMKRLIDVVNELASLGRTATNVLYDWWVDPLGVFYFQPSQAAANKWVVIGRECEKYACNPDTNEMRNAMWLTGSISSDNIQVNGWFTDATSIADYGRFDGTLTLSGIVTATDMARIATNMLILSAFPKNKRNVTIWPYREDITITDYLGIYGVPQGQTITAPSDKIVRITLTETPRGTEQKIEIGGIQPTLADIFGQQAVQQARREPALDKVKPQVAQYAVDYSVTPNVIEADLPQKPTGYGQGLVGHLVALNTNDGPMSANINGLGLQDIKMPDGNDVPPGMVTAGSIFIIVHDGTQFIMTGVPGGGALAYPHHVSHQDGGSDQIENLDLNYLDFTGGATAPDPPAAGHARFDLRITGASPNQICKLCLTNENSEEIIFASWIQ